MDFTSRMTALLSHFRRNRNGAEAYAMRLAGRAYGLNYGVSLPDIRSVARAETPDHAFARYLFEQDVRELRLSALHIAQPEMLTRDELEFWSTGITNSELAAEAAFVFLSRADIFPEVFDVWMASDDPMLVYAALMAAARSNELRVEWLEPLVGALSRTSSVDVYAAHFVAQGAVALLVALGSQSAENRRAVLRISESLLMLPSGAYISSELVWQLE